MDRVGPTPASGATPAIHRMPPTGGRRRFACLDLTCVLAVVFAGFSCGASAHHVSDPCGDSCAEDQTCCEDGSGAVCVDTDSHARHCGGCGAACKPGAECVRGTCGCPEDTVDCGDACAVLEEDERHCGGCGHPCGVEAPLCFEGDCVPCEEHGLSDCGGECADLQWSDDHCGGCNRPCEERQACVRGECVLGNCGITCPEGRICCVVGDHADDVACIDPRTDAATCGNCLTFCSWKGICVDGQCRCPEGLAACPDECAELDWSNSNCGACGRTCAENQTCIRGECFLDECPRIYCAMPSGLCCFTDIGPQCIEPRSDPSHCGGCRIECGDAERCVDGECMPR